MWLSINNFFRIAEELKSVEQIYQYHMEKDNFEEAQKCTRKVEKILQKSSQILHPNHYLLILVKRHLASESCSRLHQMDTDELKKTRDMCKQVEMFIHNYCS